MTAKRAGKKTKISLIEAESGLNEHREVKNKIKKLKQNKRWKVQ